MRSPDTPAPVPTDFSEASEGIFPLRFKAHRGLPGLEHLAPDWIVLAKSIAGARFNHMPGWYRAYLSSNKSDASSVWFVAAYRDAELVAVFPLQFQNRRVKFLQPRFLGTIDDDELQLSDFVFAKTADNASLLYELIRWLRKQRTLRWDQLRMLKIPDDSSFAYSARSRMSHPYLAVQHDASAYFDTSGTYEQATRAVSSKFKSNLRRRARLAHESGELRFQSFRRPEELHAGFQLFLDVEASGWKGSAGTSSAIRCQPAMLAFYSGLVSEFAPLGECVINVLWHGERVIAGQFGLRMGRTLHILKIGFCDEHAQLAPGILLQEMALRHACEDPAIDVVSLVNDPPWASSFKPRTLGVWLYFVPNWSVRGLLAHLGLWGKRQWESRFRAGQVARHSHVISPDAKR